MINKGSKKIDELTDFTILFERLQQSSEQRLKLLIDLDHPDVVPEHLSLSDYKNKKHLLNNEESKSVLEKSETEKQN